MKRAVAAALEDTGRFASLTQSADDDVEAVRNASRLFREEVALTAAALSSPNGQAQLSASRDESDLENEERANRLLILDDEPTVLAALRARYERLGWCVFTARTVDQAFEIGPVAVAIVDLVLGARDGLVYVKKAPRATRVYLISGGDELCLRHDARRERADGWAVKGHPDFLTRLDSLVGTPDDTR